MTDDERQQAADEAIARLEALSRDSDLEVAHVEADKVLCELLSSLGFPEVVAAFEKLEKWYA